jgi:hypothetical protein
MVSGDEETRGLTCKALADLLQGDVQVCWRGRWGCTCLHLLLLPLCRQCAALLRGPAQPVRSS